MFPAEAKGSTADDTSVTVDVATCPTHEPIPATAGSNPTNGTDSKLRSSMGSERYSDLDITMCFGSPVHTRAVLDGQDAGTMPRQGEHRKTPEIIVLHYVQALLGVSALHRMLCRVLNHAPVHDLAATSW